MESSANNNARSMRCTGEPASTTTIDTRYGEAEVKIYDYFYVVELNEITSKAVRDALCSATLHGEKAFRTSMCLGDVETDKYHLYVQTHEPVSDEAMTMLVEALQK